MEGLMLLLTFGICSVFAVAFLLWLYTKPGKKWLASL